jgi:hypothetical protein
MDMFVMSVVVIETGVVRLFKNEPGKNFGFILTDTCEEVFFHLHNGRIPRIVKGSSEITFAEAHDKLHTPRIGDRIVFEPEPSPGNKGRRAKVWAFEEDYRTPLK